MKFIEKQYIWSQKNHYKSFLKLVTLNSRKVNTLCIPKEIRMSCYLQRATADKSQQGNNVSSMKKMKITGRATVFVAKNDIPNKISVN